jgi:hypothetical protein
MFFREFSIGPGHECFAGRFSIPDSGCKHCRDWNPYLLIEKVLFFQFCCRSHLAFLVQTAFRHQRLQARKVPN